MRASRLCPLALILCAIAADPVRADDALRTGELPGEGRTIVREPDGAGSGTDPTPDPADMPMRHPRTRIRNVGISMTVLGGLALAAGAYFVFDARSIEKQVEHGSGPWSVGLDREGRESDRDAKLLLGSGAALSGAGIVLLLFAHSAHGPAFAAGAFRPSTIAMRPVAGGALLVWSPR